MSFTRLMPQSGAVCWVHFQRLITEFRLFADAKAAMYKLVVKGANPAFDATRTDRAKGTRSPPSFSESNLNPQLKGDFSGPAVPPPPLPPPTPSPTPPSRQA